MADFDSHWVERFHAIGRAQARYLWVLLLACLFYGALVKSDTGGGAALEVPVLGLKLDSGWVLASAGPVISFLLLVILGALRASSNVIAELKLGAGNYSAERLDAHPNAIDLAVYTTKKSPRLVAAVAYFAYPLFLSGALFEAAWLTLSKGASGPHPRILMAVSTVLWLPAFLQLVAMWWARARNLPTVWKAQ